MRRFALSSLIGLAALAAITSTSIAVSTEAATPAVAQMGQAISTIEGVPTEALPPSGECRIFFDQVPIDRQPAAMECEHAMWLARSWGGRVVATKGQVSTVAAEFQGRNDFAGVPSNALPPRGYCRAWIDGVDSNLQPEASDCVQARRVAAAQNGHVLFMPI